MHEIETNNTKVAEFIDLPPPEKIMGEMPLDIESKKFVLESREVVKNIIAMKDPLKRFLVVVGPCSIHDEEQAVEYATRLLTLRKKYESKLEIVMRSYFEKPRTTFGWKGLANDPFLDGTENAIAGVALARKITRRLTDIRVPLATEVLGAVPITYYSDMMTLSAVGARTTESQVHRELASGLSMPVGFKNGTDSSILIARDAVLTARQPHSFLGIAPNGRSALVRTLGNPDCFVILRGGAKGPNFGEESVREAGEVLSRDGVNSAIVVDCSHGNSNKDFRKQAGVALEVVRQRKSGNERIGGIMIESNLHEGKQPFEAMPGAKEKLKPGVSITDACIGWEETEKLLADIYNSL